MSHRSSFSVRVQLSAGNVALLLLFFSACFHSLSRYFYSYYSLVFGTLYPSYASYKAIKNKDIKEYARWMMFWVSFGLFSFIEIFTDILFSFWLPFYYEIKIIFILWLMSPYGNGAKIMYKNVIHPEFSRREEVIDSYLERAKEVGVTSIKHVWFKSSEILNVAIISIFQMVQAAVINHLERSKISQSSLLYPVIPNSALTSIPSTSSNSSTPVGTGSPGNHDCLKLLEDGIEFMDSDDVSSISSNIHIEECISETTRDISHQQMRHDEHPQQKTSKRKEEENRESSPEFCPEVKSIRIRRRKPLEPRIRPSIVKDPNLLFRR